MNQFLIFDLDGTLIDSNSIKSQVLVASVPFHSSENHAELLAFDSKNLGLSRKVRMELLYHHFTGCYPSTEELELSLSRFEDSYQASLPSILPIDGFTDLIGVLEFKRHFLTPIIISSGPQRDLDKVSELWGLNSVFEHIVSSSKTTKLEIATKIIPPGSEVLLTVGDTTVDSRLALDLGSPFYAIYGSDYSVDSEVNGSTKLFDLGSVIKKFT